MSPEEYAGFEATSQRWSTAGGHSLWDRGRMRPRGRVIMVRLEGARLKGRRCTIEPRGRQSIRPLLRCDGDGGEG